MELTGRLGAPLPDGSLDRYFAGFADRFAAATSDEQPLGRRLEALKTLDLDLEAIRADRGLEKSAAALDGELRRRYSRTTAVLRGEDLSMDLPGKSAPAHRIAEARLSAIHCLDPRSGEWGRLDIAKERTGRSPVFLPPRAGLCLLYDLKGEGGGESVGAVVLLPREARANLDGPVVIPPLPRSMVEGRSYLYVEEDRRAVLIDRTCWSQKEVLSRLARRLDGLGTVGPAESAAIRRDLGQLFAASNLPPALRDLAARVPVDDLAKELAARAEALGAETFLIQDPRAAGGSLRKLLADLLLEGAELPGEKLAGEILRLRDRIGFDPRGAGWLLDQGLDSRAKGGGTPGGGICTVLRLVPREPERKER
jgi:hypothetical protein